MGADRIVVSLATIPARAESCDKAIASLEAQTVQPEAILVEMNGFDREEFTFREQWLEREPGGIVVARNQADRAWVSRDRSDDAMKFCFDFSREGFAMAPVWRIVCDDDLIYPPDYIERMIAAAKTLGCPVSAHGVTLKRSFFSYYRSREVHHCTRRVREAQQVDVLGTGALCYRSDWLDLAIEDFPLENMADTQLAVLMKKRGIPGYVVPHEAGWIKLADPNDRDTIWHASRRRDGSAMDTGAAQTALIRENAGLFGLELAYRAPPETPDSPRERYGRILPRTNPGRRATTAKR